MSGGPKLTNRQESLIAALLAAPTIAQAAKAAGISEATATRWLKDTTFAEAYREARREALDRVMASLEQTMLAAVLVLRSIMLDANTPASTRVRAALGLLEIGLNVSVIEAQEERLKALERAQGQRP